MSSTAASPATRGLGRGLAAILGPDHPTHSVHDSTLLERLVDAGLQSLRQAVPLSFCGYIHRRTDSDPRVFLAVPEVRSLSADDAYRLFDTWRIANSEPSNPADFDILGWTCRSIDSGGPRSTGVYVVGVEPNRAEHLDLAAAFARLYAPVIHCHDVPPVPGEEATLSIEDGQDNHHVEASFRYRGRAVIGFGSATDVLTSTAMAVVNAVSDSIKLQQVARIAAADGTVMLVTLETNTSHGVGSAPVNAVLPQRADAPAAVATATMRAIQLIDRQ